tara:strand:+ start:60 stop:875 length:816 start_codon:yes stop_codon:yes gene_type:complete
MAGDEDSLTPKTPGLDRLAELQKGSGTTTPGQMYAGLKGLHGEAWLEKHGIEKPKERGLRTGGLKTGKLELGEVGEFRKLPRSATGGGLAVVVDDAAPHVREIVKEKIESFFIQATPLQQWQVYRSGTADNTVKVYKGIAFYAQGTQTGDDVVNTKEVVATSGDLTVTEAGSIWASWTVEFVQLSTSSASSGVVLTGWRQDDITFVDHTFRTTAAAVSPVYNNADEWKAGGDLTFWVELAQVQLVDGVVGVVTQFQAGSVQIPNFTDFEIS